MQSCAALAWAARSMLPPVPAAASAARWPTAADALSVRRAERERTHVTVVKPSTREVVVARAAAALVLRRSRRSGRAKAVPIAEFKLAAAAELQHIW